MSLSLHVSIASPTELSAAFALANPRWILGDDRLTGSLQRNQFFGWQRQSPCPVRSGKLRPPAGMSKSKSRIVPAAYRASHPTSEILAPSIEIEPPTDVLSQQFEAQLSIVAAHIVLAAVGMNGPASVAKILEGPDGTSQHQ